MSLLKKLAGETAVYGLSSILGRLLNYLLTPFYTRLFVESEYGVVSELYALAGFLMVFFICRMETAFFRYGTEAGNRERSFSTALWSVAGSSLFFSVLIVIFSGEIILWLDYPPERTSFVVMFGLILALDTLAEIPLARLRLEHRAGRFALVRITGILLNIGFNFFFLIICPWMAVKSTAPGILKVIWNSEFGIGYIFLSNFLASAGVLMILLPEMRKLRLNFDFLLWRKMFVYAAPLIIASLAGIVNEMMDRELLKHWLPGSTQEKLAQIGIYSACYKLAMLMSLFTQAFRYAAEPFFFSNMGEKNARVMYAEVTKYFVIAGMLVFLSVLFYLNFFQYFIAAPYRVGLHVVPILLMANLFLGIYYNVSIWYKLTDRTRFGAWVALGGACITVVLNYLLIPAMGFTGSAWATLVCYALMTIVCWWWGRRYYFIEYDLKAIGFYIGLGLFLFGLHQYLETSQSQMPVWIMNIFLLFVFIWVVWRKEKKLREGLLAVVFQLGK